MELRPPGTSGSPGSRTGNMTPSASGLHAQPPTYAAHMHRGCVSVAGTGPHPTLSSADLLTGFCPGGVGVRVRTASWSPGKGVKLGHNSIGAHLGSTVSQGSSPPHSRLAGSSALLLSPLASMEKCGGWGLGWSALIVYGIFRCTPLLLGCLGKGCSHCRAKMAQHWARQWTRLWPHSCSVGLPRDGTFWSPVLIGTLTAKEVPAVEYVSTPFSGQ
jgi:hypothetical protein